MKRRRSSLLFSHCLLLLVACASHKVLLKNDCCQKVLTIDYSDKPFIESSDYELARYAYTRTDSAQAQLLIPTKNAWLIPCRYCSVVVIEKNFICSQKVFRPAARAIKIEQLDKIAQIYLTILETDRVNFDYFLTFLMQNPPDQAQYVHYLGSQAVKADKPGTPAPLYCQHSFALYRLKDPADQETLKRFTKK